MIKQIRAAFYHNKKNAQYCCLSEDIENAIPDCLKNGDEVYFIDTGKKYVYDAVSGQLYEKPSGGGGGGTSVYPYDSDPEALGQEASPGTSDDFSRGDHVHPFPTASDVGALPLTGGTMSGAIAMGSYKITGLADGENNNDAVSVQQMASAISQSSAYFRGSFASNAALLAVAWQTSNPSASYYVTNNDYAIVLDDETHNDECWRYLYVSGTGWTAQYRINETPLTQAQINALNSGATTQNISSIANKADKFVEVTVNTSGAVTQALDAGKIYHFTGALTALTITLNAAASGQLAQYHFDFDSGATPPTFTLPNTVVMPTGFAVAANTHYEIDILNNFGAVIAWAIS